MGVHETATPTIAAADPSKLKDTVEDSVNEQYDTDASMAFYEHVMGGGGDDIHYGLFLSPSDGLRESSQNSVEHLAKMGEEAGTLKPGVKNADVKVLDLGSGKGGAARYLASTYGCTVTCFNLGKKQNDMNKAKAVEAGIGELIEPVVGSFNEPLPVDWTDKFDMVWSQEAFCHCMDHHSLMAEIQRVLKPDGTIVFSDIMQGDNGGDCSSFTGQNVTTKLATPSMYKDAIAASGMKLLKHDDLTHHLTKYFQCMLSAVKDSKLPLQMKGVSMARLEAYEEDLVTRFDAVKQRAFAWGMFSAKNPLSSDVLMNGALQSEGVCPTMLEAYVKEQYDSDTSMLFYKTTMGGGSDYVHYGILNSSSDTLADASHNTVVLLAELARRVSPLGLEKEAAAAAGAGAKRRAPGGGDAANGKGSKRVRVLDLGSGTGGVARHLACTFGCHVTCYNLGQRQNDANEKATAEAGLQHLVECRCGNFNHGLPAEWTACFDVVWSQESFCHATDQRALISEVSRVLKPGGAVIFTDIMRQGGSAADLAVLDVSLSEGSIADPVATDVSSTGGSVSEPSGEAQAASSPIMVAAGAPRPLSSRQMSQLSLDDGDAAPPPSSSYGRSLISKSCSTKELTETGQTAAGATAGMQQRLHDFGFPQELPPEEVNVREAATVLHPSSPGAYLQHLRDADMKLVDYRDLTAHLVPFYGKMLAQIDEHEAELVAKGVSSTRIETTRADLRNRTAAVQAGTLAWAAFTARKPANASALVIGGGPLGSFVAARLARSGVANVTLKVLPTVAPEVVEMVSLSGVTVVEEWSDLTKTEWGSVMIAVKTHWLPQIALEMSCAQVTFENLCMVYNGYTQDPEYFSGFRCCRAVVPQSFSFDDSALLAWDVAHGNAHNPWNLPPGKVSSAVVGMLTQSGINARCDPTFHRSAFFKFCVNNAANLLSVIEEKNCRQLCASPECVTMMKAILNETFDVLELDPIFSAVVPMHRRPFIQDVLFDAKGSVASYAEHFPSSHHHYMQHKLVDTRALNGFVVRKARQLNTTAHLNEYIARQVCAITDATSSGVTRQEWDMRVKLAAAKRLVEQMGCGTSVWGHASVRSPVAEGRMLLAPFGEAFGEATASALNSTPLHPEQLTAAERESTNITAVVLHGGVYKARRDATAIIHTHSPWATALASSELDFDPEVCQDAMQFVGRVAYHPFGGVADESEEMEAVAAAARNADVLILRNHGVIVLGEDTETAFSRLYYLERCCQTQLLLLGAGAKVAPAGKVGVDHTVEWYAKDGVASAHAEWKAHVRRLHNVECGTPRTMPFWFE